MLHHAGQCLVYVEIFSSLKLTAQQHKADKNKCIAQLSFVRPTQHTVNEVSMLNGLSREILRRRIRALRITVYMDCNNNNYRYVTFPGQIKKFNSIPWTI